MTTALFVGDDIISTEGPATVLVVAGPEWLALVQEALDGNDPFFRIDACPDLQSALEEARSGMYDAVLLTLQLPDAWPADAFDRLRQEVGDLPILVIAQSEDQATAAIRKASSPPFAMIDEQRVDPASVRRLIVSAVLLRRAGGKPTPGRRAAKASDRRKS